MAVKLINPLLEVKNKGMNLINPFILNPLRSNLIAEWKFEGNANDSSGNGLGGTVTGSLTTVVGKVGNCYSFPGGANYVSINDNDKFSFTDGSGTDKPFTFTFWMHTAGSGYVLSKYSSGSNAEYYLQPAAPYLTMYLTNPTQSTYLYTRVNYSAYYNTWVFVSVVYTGNNNESGITISLNGYTSTNTRGHGGTYLGMSNGTSKFYIGGNNIAGYTGLLDEVRLFNKALSLAEVNQVMNWS